MIINKAAGYAAAGLAALCTLIAPGVSPAETDQQWRFRVFLDQREIGEHSFELIDEGNGLELRSAANFRVRFLFFNAYRYDHVNVERWDGNCLTGIDASTEINGERQIVRGERRDGEFVVSTDEKTYSLPGCIMTFAYWNPSFLDESRLLNSQTGEFVDVEISAADEAETLQLKDRSVTATRYRVVADELDIALWYSPDREWLALESTLESGRTLRYEPI